MPRQLQGSYASFSDAKTPAPKYKGGTGARSSVAAAVSLGAIHKSKFNKPGGILQLDEAGFIPSKYLEDVSSPHSRAIVGPLVLLPGILASYQITDFDSHQVPEISIDAGTAELNGDTISVVAPFNRRNVTLVISGRKITIPIEVSPPETPAVVSPTQGAESHGSIIITLAPYHSEPAVYSDWTTIPLDMLTSVDFPTTTTLIEVQGRRGTSGQAYVSVSGVKYGCGIATTNRVIRLKGESAALMVASGTGSLKYRLGSPNSVHLSTDWEVATDADFNNIVFSSYEDTVNLLQIEISGLPTGTYYTRARYNGQLNTLVPEAPVILSPATNSADHTASIHFTSSAFVTPTDDTHVSSDWELATDSYFKNVFKSVTSSTTDKTSWTATGLMPESIYFVRVRHNGALHSPGVWSQAIKVRTIASYAPIQPSIVFPETNTTDTKPTVTFTSTDFISPLDEPHLSSDWELARDIDFNLLVRSDFNSDTHKTTWTTNGLAANTSYYARVRYNAAHGLSAWSLPVKITTSGSYVPLKPTIIYPLSGTVGFGNSMLIQASDYISPIDDPHVSSDWEVATDAEFTNIVVSSQNDTNSLQSFGFANLTANTIYYVRVRYRSANGISVWSDVVSAQTLPTFAPIEPTITRPTANQMHVASIDTKYTTTMFNSPVNDTHVYTSWQIATDAEFTNIVEQSLLDQDNLTAWRSTVLEENTMYYVRAKHHGLHHGSTQWSIPIAFTTISLENVDGKFRVMSPDREYLDNFGHAVTVSGDGNTVLIGAHREDVDTGSVYAYIREGEGFVLQAKLSSAVETNGDFFGYSVDVSNDGNIAVVGAPNDDEQLGASFIFTRSSTTWNQRLKLTANDRTNLVNQNSHFGHSVAISKNATTVAIGAPNANDDSGSVYVFIDSETTWVQQAKLMAGDAVPGDLFGTVVTLSQDGNTLAVSAVEDDTGAGSVYIFTRTGTTWTQQTKITASDRVNGDHFGHALDLSDSGDTLVVSAIDDDNSSGSAYVFVRTGTTWTQVTKLVSSEALIADHFGRAVAISGEGNVITVSCDNDAESENIGKVYIFCYIDGVWVEYSSLTAYDGDTEDQFGASLKMSTDGSVIAIGSPMTDGEQGAVYLAGFTIAPSTPSIVTPVEGTDTVGNLITVTATPYNSPVGDTHVSTDWQLSSNSDFSAIQIESLADTTNKTSFSFGYLTPNKTYYVRVRYNTGSKSSNWSTPVSFKTLVSFNPYAPLILAPAIVGGIMPITVDGTDPFNVTFTTGTIMSPISAAHVTTDWEFASGTEFTNILDSEYASVSKTSRVTNIQNFVNQGFTSVYYRVRHRDVFGHIGDWTTPVQIIITTP